jgi:hypothetical protein
MLYVALLCCAEAGLEWVWALASREGQISCACPTRARIACRSDRLSSCVKETLHFSRFDLICNARWRVSTRPSMRPIHSGL